MAGIELHPGAEHDLLDAARWYDDQRPGIGDEFTAEVMRCLLLIAAAPERWPLHPGRGAAQRQIRRYVMDDFPYMLPYLVRGETTFVLAVAHTSRKPRYWVKRLA